MKSIRQEKILDQLKNEEPDRDSLLKILQIHGPSLQGGYIDWLLGMVHKTLDSDLAARMLSRNVELLPNATQQHLTTILDHLFRYTSRGLDLLAEQGELETFLSHPGAGDKLQERVLELLPQTIPSIQIKPVICDTVEVEGFWTPQRIEGLLEDNPPETAYLLLEQGDKISPHESLRKLFEELIRESPSWACVVMQKQHPAPWTQDSDWATILAHGGPDVRKQAVRAQKERKKKSGTGQRGTQQYPER